MSAKSDHRAGVFEAARNDVGMVRCYADPSERTCRGRLQAAHWIAAQSLRTRSLNARIELGRRSRDRYAWDGKQRLASANLDDLIADPRNGAAMCEMHHQAFDHHRLTLTPPQSVIDFCNEFGLSHLLDRDQLQEAAA